VIEVTPKELGIRIPSDFIGFSYETRNLKRDEVVFGENDAELVLLYSNLGKGVIRVGGKHTRS
jgi:hypothetical protein